MGSTATSRRGRHSRSRKTGLFGGRNLLAGIAIAALAIVGALIFVQAANSGTATLPDRVGTGEGRTLGAAEAPVTVVLYADFQCPACKRAELDVLPRLQEDYVLPGRANIEFRMFPFLGQESWDAAQAAEAAREQGRFWEYHDALWNAQSGENRGAFRYDRLVELARDVGLDVERFEATLSSNTYLDAVQQEADAARDAGVASTPTFFIGNEKIVGAQDYAVFQAAIERALAEAEL